MARLGPLANGDKSQGTVLALLIGAEPTQYNSAVALLTRQMRGGKVMPVAVTDREDNTALRAAPAAVGNAAGREFEELVLSPTFYGTSIDCVGWRYFGATCQPLPVRGLQPEAQALLEAWRKSPFEADFPGPDLGTDRSNPRD